MHEKNVQRRDKKTRTQQTRSNDSTSHSSESEQEEARHKEPRPALEYRVTHLTDKSLTGTELLCVEIPIQQSHTGTANMLYDFGSAILLIKLKYLKDETPAYGEKVTLTGVTGHQMQTVGKIYATIKLNTRKLKHAIYVISDDFPIEQNGILGIDFLRQQSATCDYTNNRIKIGESTLKLYPSERICLKPRSETIIRASTTRNLV